MYLSGSGEGVERLGRDGDTERRERERIRVRWGQAEAESESEGGQSVWIRVTVGLMGAE